jgi:hypothetical protein
MFDERANPEVTKGFAERLLVIAFIGGKRPQIARIRRAICSARSASLPPRVVEQCQSITSTAE